MHLGVSPFVETTRYPLDRGCNRDAGTLMGSFWRLGAARHTLHAIRCVGDSAIAVLASLQSQGHLAGRIWSHEDISFLYEQKWWNMSVLNWKPELKYSKRSIYFQASSCLCWTSGSCFMNLLCWKHWEYLACHQPHLHLIQQLLAVRPVCSRLTFYFPCIGP